MKKIITIIFLLIGACAYAQHKPLKHIELNKASLAQSGAKKVFNDGLTIEAYTAYFYSERNHIKYNEDLTSGKKWQIMTLIDSDEIFALKNYTSMSNPLSSSPDFYDGDSKLTILVGESAYEIEDWYFGEHPVYPLLHITINKEITEHISISGFQGIGSNGIEIIAFSEIEQELWRRTAKDVYDTCKDK